MNNYVLNDEIGQGAFSTIYKGRYRTTTEFYAIASIDKKRRERVVNCVQLLRSMRHLNIIAFHNWYETNNHLWIITEYCTGGDMRTILRSNIDLTIQAVQAFGRDIAMGLMYIHSKGVLYNDLQTRNLLMDSAAMLRFHDFCLACSFHDAATRPLVGTPLYMAPELFMADRPLYSMASDLWSFGCVLHELATGKPPFAASDLETLLSDILTRPAETVPNAPESFQRLLRGLLEKDPLKRYTWADIACSEFWDEPVTLPSSGFPPEVVWDSYKRSRGGRAASPQSWTDADVREAVAQAVAAAKSNASTHNVQEKERSAARLNVAKELDFTVSAEQRAAMLLEQLPQRTPERATRSTDHGATGHDKVVHGCLSTVCAASNAADENGAPFTAITSARLSHISESKTAGGDPQRRRVSKVRGPASSRASGSAAVAYEGGRAAYAASGSSKEDRPPEANLRVFADGELLHLNIKDLLSHHTDQHIRPLSNNSRIEYSPEPSYDIATLGFTALTAAEINHLMGKEHTAFFRSLYLSLSNMSSGYDHVLNAMNYVISLCGDAEVARASVNSSVMRLCVKHAGRRDASAEFRAAAALIMGLLVRTTAFITPEVASSSILPDIMRLFEEETDVLVKRKLIACIGEFLFYIAVQQERQRAMWNVQSATVKRIYASALDSDDDVLKHYAAKMIENMASTTQKEMSLELFAEPVFVEKLLAVFALSSGEGRSEDMRSDAACAAFKLALLKDELILTVMRSKWFHVTSYAAVMQRSSVAHTIQILLTFLNHAIVKGLATLQNPFVRLWSQATLDSCNSGSGSSGRLGSPFTSSLSVEDAEEVVGNALFVSEDLLENLSEAIEQASVAVYGKTLLFVMLIGCVGGSSICHILNSRIVAFLDRLVRDADSYVKHCGAAMSAFLGWFVSDKLAGIARRVSSTSTPTHLAAIQQLLNNSAVRSGIDFQKDVFQSLSTCIDKAMSNTLYGTYRDEFNRIADRFVESPEVVLRYEESICRYLATSYAEMLRRKEASGRFTAIRFLTSAMVPISAEVTATRKESSCATSAARQVLNAVTPNVFSLLLDTSPIPTNTMRLLVTCGEMAQSKLSSLVSEQLLSHIMDYVNGSSDDDDMYYPLSFIHLCLLVCQRVDVVNYVVRQGLCALVLQTLGSAITNKNDQLVEMCCNLLAVLVRHVAGDSSSRVTVQCASCVQKNSIGFVLLPLCADTSNSTATMESAAAVIEGFVRLSEVARSDLTTASTIALWADALSSALLTSAKRTVAVSLLTALGTSCELASHEVLQALKCNARLMSVLGSAADSTHMRLVTSEANKVLKQLS
ncbi:hypothetical protein CUR178_04415 [Leishmania enriettii]|uniref:non-specific serine/threonine protein kinase n=1 Tax=Leishmania enriettii TaxID=5663 RepID=A0A836KLH0_LEIEN|nr:hypothetical protein CUR178_04415 [Leishmania enriettii]